MLGSRVLPDLLETMQIVALEIHFRFDGHDLGGISRIKNVEVGKTFDFPERHPQNLRAEAGPTHAQQERIFEASLLDVLAICFSASMFASCSSVMVSQPSQCFRPSHSIEKHPFATDAQLIVFFQSSSDAATASAS